MDNGKVLPDGRVDYDPDGLKRFTGTDDVRDNLRYLQDGVRLDLHYVGKLVKTLHNIRKMRPAGSKDAQSARKQSEALRDLMTGSLGYGLSYEDVLRILVQLAVCG